VIRLRSERTATLIGSVPVRTSLLATSTLGRVAVTAGALLRVRWAGYLAGLLLVVVWTVLQLMVIPGRLANASALYTIPVLVTAARYGRGPSLLAALAAFVAFDWFFAESPKVDPAHVLTLLVFLAIALVASQLVVMLRQQVEVARQRERETVTLYDVARLVPGSTLELEPLLGWILDQMQSIVRYDAAAVVLHDKDDAVFVVEYRGPLPREHVVGLPVHPDWPMATLLDAVTSRREPVIVGRIARPILESDLIAGLGSNMEPGAERTELAVPLLIKGRVIGMQLLLRSAAHPYTARQAELAMTFAQQAASAIDNARFVRRCARPLERNRQLAAVGRHPAPGT
jgi:K+-sensing histidine kinase KdpD